MSIKGVQEERAIAAFAEAVIKFLRTDAPQGIHWDPEAAAYCVTELEPGTAPDDVDFYIGSTWAQWLGHGEVPALPLVGGEISEETLSGYSELIRKRLEGSGTAVALATRLMRAVIVGENEGRNVPRLQ